MPNWHALIERLLPWYHPSIERLRNARTERISRRSAGARARAEQVKQVISEYRRAEAVADKAVEKVIDEAQRDDT